MLNQILDELNFQINSVTTSQELQKLKISFLGKKSLINQEMSKLKDLGQEERKHVGQEINKIKIKIQEIIDAQEHFIKDKELNEQLMQERIDLTIDARQKNLGSIHPITQCLEELLQIFSKFGFVQKDGPNIESDWYNFEALNIPKNHPARQMHDTFYLRNGHLLRTHTSNVQIRTMESQEPPIRIVSAGRVYRSDSDATHTPVFHQIEGLVVDRNINMSHLKYVIIEFIKDFFEKPDIQIQFRPSFFPFTEPSAEVDIAIDGSNWLEVLGCGMVHPKVLQNVNIDPDKYQAFAFGLGVERFAMLKYGISDLREFFDGDMRWIKHYNFDAFDVPNLARGLTK